MKRKKVLVLVQNRDVDFFFLLKSFSFSNPAKTRGMYKPKYGSHNSEVKNNNERLNKGCEISKKKNLKVGR